MIKIGDRVKFLSDTSVGVVTKLQGDIVFVDVEDGFEIPVAIYDLVVVNKQDELDAIERIGRGDEKPGTKRAVHGIKQKREEPIVRDRAAYARYGKVSLVDNSSDEDGEELLDMDRIKDNYLKGLLAVQQREREFEQQELKKAEELSKIREHSPVKVFDPSETPAKAVLAELKDKIKSDTEKPVVVAPQKKVSDVEVIDLHAEELLESSNGMTNGEIITVQLSRFTSELDAKLKTATHGKIVFIHGVGKGRLRFEIEKILKWNYSKLKYQDASFQEYGYGAILIYF